MLGQPVEAVRNLVDTVYYDYQVKLMAALWGDAFASPASERAPAPAPAAQVAVPTAVTTAATS